MPPISNENDQGWFSRERILILTLGIATLIALYVCYLIVQPFIPAIAIAVAVAVATKRPQAWLRRRLHSQTAAAAVSVALVASLLVIPLSLLITYLIRQIIASIHGWQADGGFSEWRSIVHLPPPMGRAFDWAQANLDLQSQFSAISQSFAGQAGNLLAGSVSLVTQLVIMLFVLFFLYRDRDKALNALRHLLPLSAEEVSRMGSRIENTILAIVNGSLTVAFVQALLASVMYMVLGVPASVIWGCATFIAALIPMFGTFMVWGPVAVFLMLSGSWAKAIILVAWGGLAVGSIDNLLYPYLVGNRLRLHTIPTFFAILGGIKLFGPAGLILGPVSLAVTIGLLDVWRSRTTEGRMAEQRTPSNH
jgi:predicted PurR-regulated permease PerM